MVYQVTMIVLTCLSGLAEYGALMLNINSKPLLWRRGMYIGMVGSAYCICALMIPHLNLYPMLVFIGSTAFMLGSLFISYYLTPISQELTRAQRMQRLRTKQSTVRQLGVGLMLTVCLACMAGYMQRQTIDNRVQQGYTGVVDRLADEVGSLRNSLHDLSSAVRVLTEDVKELKRQAKADSVARRRSQEQLLKTIKKSN